MSYYRGYESGHSRGGVDVTEAVNLAFKGILLSPIFILCIFITLAMLKHMLFGGIPSMNQPTESQREELRERDSEINPREVWGGSPEGPRVESITEVPTPVLPVTPDSQQVEVVEKDVYMNRPTIHELREEPEVIPFTIYD